MDSKANPKLVYDFVEIVDTTLSSKDSFSSKCVYMSLIIVYWPAVFFSYRNYSDWKLYFLLFLLWLMFLTYFYCTLLRTKEVHLSERGFIISNFIKKIHIDISEVESIGGSLFLYPEFIWLNLKSNSEFGKKIIFIAKPRESFFRGLTFTRHPLVEKLTNFCKAYNEIV